MNARLLGMNEITDEKKSARTKKPFTRRFSDEQQHLRWQNLIHIASWSSTQNHTRRALPILQKHCQWRQPVCLIYERRPADGAKAIPAG